MDINLKKYLEKNKIAHSLHKHLPVHRVSDSKKIKDNLPAMHCKCLFLKSEKFYLIAMKADKRLNLKFFKDNFKIKKIKFANELELKEKLNTTPGSVSIFNIIYAKEISIIIDKEVWDAEYTGFHPNQNNETLILNKENLHKYIKSFKLKTEILPL